MRNNILLSDVKGTLGASAKRSTAVHTPENKATAKHFEKKATKFAQKHLDRKNERAAEEHSKAKASEKATADVVKKDTKAHNKQASKEARLDAKRGGSDNPYKGRKNIVDTPHGPAVDLDAVERPKSKSTKAPKSSSNKVPAKKKKK